MKKLLALLFACFLAVGCAEEFSDYSDSETSQFISDESTETIMQAYTLPVYDGQPYTAVNGNQPVFTEEELTVSSLKEFGELDELGRCTYAIICAGPETLPSEKRGNISEIHPTGWVQNRYSFVEQEALYNRSHLIAFSLCGENANKNNLITGTRYMNAYAMEPFESMIVDYIKETGNHVLYEVIPVFEGNNLLASGVFMQGASIEDEGEGICFSVYCFNVQPGIEIEYATGNNEEANPQAEKEEFILNTYKRLYHDPDCVNAAGISARNEQDYYGTEEILIAQGYTPASDCLQ